MPGSPRPRTRSHSRRSTAALAAVLASLQTSAVLLANHAAAAPSPSPSPSASATGSSDCSLIVGPAKDLCEKGSSGSGSTNTITDTLDPLTSLSKGCAKAASAVIDKLSEAVTNTTQVDFTNAAFLRQYAVVFAASTILTLVLWLLAVAKRAVRGVPLTEALTEAVGFLWLTVIASAFTPLILYTLVSATDAVTEVISAGTGTNTDMFFGSFSDALTKGTDIGGGPIMLIIVSLISVLAAGVLYLELVIRAALLYVGALLGTAVYSGMVDKNMWHHVRRWAGIMIAIILVKPVIVIVLGLAGALSTSSDGPNAFSAVVSGLSIILLAIFASAMIYRFVPGFGDDVQSLRSSRKISGEGTAAAVISSPAALVKQGIKTHSSRGPQEQGGSGGGGGGNSPANGVSGGVAAHSTRGGGGSGAPAAPAPRTAPPSAGRNTGTGTSTSSKSGGDSR
jgi:hypothetical protein